MICMKCGKPLYDGDAFCVHCGASRSGDEGAVANNRKIARYKAILCCAIVVALIAAVGLVVWYTGHERVVRNYFKALETGNATKLENQVYAQYWKEYYNDYYERYAEEEVEQWQSRYGEEQTIEYEVVQKRHITGPELRELEEEIEDRYLSRISTSIRVRDAYLVKVSYFVDGEKRNGEDEWTILLIKENGKWRMAMNRFNSVDYDFD